jgi:DNA repair exonuclease SbcCD ATPase subunit
MIVRGLRAQNVLKYARLDLSGLPSEGRIAVTGPNEAGKTAICEIICLALFGRSFAVPPAERSTTIKWGEPKGSVELDFGARDGEQYTVTRYLNRDGGHDASLSRSVDGQTVARGVEAVHRALVPLIGFDYGEFVDTFYLAQREISVPHSQSDTVKAIVGIGAMERAAREITEEIAQERASIERRKQEVTSLNLQVMELDYHPEAEQRLRSEQQAHQQGIAERRQEIEALESTDQALDRAFRELRRVAEHVPITEIETPYASWRDYLEKLSQALSDLDRVCQPNEAPPLVQAAADLRSAGGQLDERLRRFTDLHARAAAYQRSIAGLLGERSEGAEASPSLPQEQEGLCRRLGETRRLQRRAGYLSWLSALIASGVVIAWVSLTAAPNGRVASFLLGVAKSYLPGWRPLQGSFGMLALTGLAAALTLIALLVLARALMLRARSDRLRHRVEELGARIERLRKESEILRSLDQIPLPEALAALGQIDDPGVSQAVVAFIGGPDNPLLDTQALNELFERLRSSLAACDAQVTAQRQGLRETIERLAAEIEGLEASVAQQQRTLEDELEKRGRAQELAGLTTELDARIAEQARRITVGEVALGLVGDAGRELTARFNRDLQAYLPDVLSRLTGGRYRFLQITDDFGLRVFSTEKNDFADLDELSSGARRQVALAVRLALATALAQTADHGPQCLILDEPFAFFDRERTRETLEGLPFVSKPITQIWMVSEQLEPDPGFTLEIRCMPDQDTLVVKAA